MATPEEIARARAYFEAKFSPAGMLGGGGIAPPLMMPTTEVAGDPIAPPPPAALPLGGGMTYAAPPPSVLRAAPSPGALSPALIEAARSRMAAPPPPMAGPVPGPTPEAIQAARSRLGGSAAGQAYPEALDALRAARAEAVDVVKTPEPLRDARGELTKAYGTAMDSIVPEEEKAKREVDNAYGTARNAVRALQRPGVGERIRDDNAAIAGTFDAEGEAVRKAADAETAKALAASSRMEEMANLQARKAREEEKIAADADAERTRYREQTDRLATELREKKIDPSRLYGNQSTAERISFAIMGAIGGLHQAAFKSQSNPFLDQLNKNIDRDIAAQVHDLDTQKSVLAERQSIYGQMRAAHGDSALARGQVKAAMLDAAKMQLESEAARIGTPIAQARADQQIAGIDRQAAELRRNNDVAEAQAAQRAAQAAAAARAAAEEKAFQRGTTLEKLRLEDKKIELEHGGKALEKMDERFVQTDVDSATKQPKGYFARNAKVAEEQTEGLAAAQEAVELARRILGRRTKEGAVGRLTSRGEDSPLGTPTWKTANQVDQALMLTKANRAAKLGTLDSGSKPILEAMTGKDPNALDLIGNDTDDRLREFISANERFLEIQRNAQAGQQVQKVVKPDGREQYVRLGKANVTSNPRTEQRFGPDGKPLK